MINVYVHTEAGFGNVLFMVLNGASTTRENNGLLKIIHRSNPAGRPHISAYHLFRNFSIEDPKNAVQIYKEKHFYYTPRPIFSSDVLLYGFFQSWKYFTGEDIDNVKRLMFENSDKVKEWQNEFQNKFQDKKVLLLHVRRTDYVQKHETHNCQPEEYYINALDKIYDDHTILASSDDIMFLKKWDLLKKYNHKILNEGVEKTFVWMTMCDDYIIANSTLSLLSYYFRDKENAKLIAPHKWFGPDGPEYKIEDIVRVDEKVTLL